MRQRCGEIGKAKLQNEFICTRTCGQDQLPWYIPWTSNQVQLDHQVATRKGGRTPERLFRRIWRIYTGLKFKLRWFQLAIARQPSLTNPTPLALALALTPSLFNADTAPRLHSQNTFRSSMQEKFLPLLLIRSALSNNRYNLHYSNRDNAIKIFSYVDSFITHF